MSVPVLTAFLERSRSTLATRLVGMVISDAAGIDGIAWIEEETIAERALVSERKVRDAIRELERLGEIETRQAQRGRRRVNVYRVRMGAKVPQYERLPFELDDPFSDDDRQKLPVVDDRQSATRRPAESSTDDRQSATARIEDEPNENVSELATAAPPRPRDLVWDTLAELFGAVVDGTQAHGKRNRAVADLKRYQAAPDQIRAARRAWPKLMGAATCTDVALATHFPQLLLEVDRARPTPAGRHVEPLPEISEEERAEQIRRIRELGDRVGRDAA